jgi:hypothetical protein
MISASVIELYKRSNPEELAMNKKSKSKKLTLSAETLRNLNEPQTQQVVGGATALCTRFCSRLDCTDTLACSGCQPCA